jgi:peptide deformylase
MAILKVARMGHPVLRAVARPLSPADVRTAEMQALIDNMIETMVEYRGVGLAAPQIHEGIRLFVADLNISADDEAEPEPVAIINPEIVPVGAETVEDWEGCLSIPDLRGRVPRHRDIRVRGLGRDGRRLELRAKNFAARVIQHETDHLDGVLYFDRMKGFESLTFLDEYARFWAKPDDDEE